MNSLRELLFHLRKGLAQGIHRGDGVGVGRLVNTHGRCGASVDSGGHGVALGAELYLGNIAQAHGFRTLLLLAHDDVAELLQVRAAALVADGVGELLTAGHGLGTHGTAGVDGVLLLDGIRHLADGDVLLRHLGGIQPNTHRVLAAEHLHLAHAFHALESLHHVDVGVARQVNGVEGLIGGVQLINHQR